LKRKRQKAKKEKKRKERANALQSNRVGPEVLSCVILPSTWATTLMPRHLKTWKSL
jgi:hypothetical protein